MQNSGPRGPGIIITDVGNLIITTENDPQYVSWNGGSATDCHNSFKACHVRQYDFCKTLSVYLISVWTLTVMCKQRKPTKGLFPCITFTLRFDVIENVGLLSFLLKIFLNLY